MYCTNAEVAVEFFLVKEMLTKYCCSELARKRLLELSILTSKEELFLEQTYVSEVLEMRRQRLKIPLTHFSSVRTYLKKIQLENSSIFLEEIAPFLEQFKMVIQIKRFFETHFEKMPMLAQKVASLISHKEVLQTLYSFLSESGTIRDSATPELKKIRHSITLLQDVMRKKNYYLTHEKYKRYVVEDLETIRNGRCVLSVKSNFRNEVKGIVHDFSNTGATVYIEPYESVSDNENLLELKQEEERETYRILKKIADVLRPLSHEILFNEKIIVFLDVVNSKASYGIEFKGIIPKWNKVDRTICLKDVFHPILLKKYPKEKVVPLTIKFGNKNARIVLISGPNAGGKTVLIKTVGLVCFMFQTAIPITCHRETFLPIYHKIFCDIGDKQSILNDLSTFTSHIQNIKTILKNVSTDSLVLIDELGTGTDPKEGAALSNAIIVELLKQNSTVLATTHLGELKLYANSLEGVQNASMAFDKEALCSTYEFQMGVPGQSHAFFIAEKLGMPDKIIFEAKKLSDKNYQKLENLINDLTSRIVACRRLEDTLHEKNKKISKLKDKYEKKIEHLKKRQLEIYNGALEKSEKMLQNVNKTIEESILKIRASEGDKKVIKKAREEVKQVKRRLEIRKTSLNKVHPKREKLSLKIGDQVRHRKLGSIGDVIDIKGEKIHVQFGHINTISSLGELDLVEPKNKNMVEHGKVSINYENFSQQIPNEINLRGLTVDKAWAKCDEYIDMAFNTGWKFVTLIHGKGSGVLRKGLNEYLRHDKRVQKKRRGNEGEGDTGVTIVELKKPD